MRSLLGISAYFGYFAIASGAKVLNPREIVIQTSGPSCNIHPVMIEYETKLDDRLMPLNNRQFKIVPVEEAKKWPDFLSKTRDLFIDSTVAGLSSYVLVVELSNSIGIIESTMNVLSRKTELEELIEAFWTVTGLGSPKTAFDFFIEALHTAPVQAALAQLAVTTGIVATGVILFRYRERIMSFFKTAWDMAKKFVKRIFGYTRDAEANLTQVVAMSKLAHMYQNASIVPDRLRERLAPYILERISMKDYLSWVKQSAQGNNGINLYLLAKYAGDLIENPYQGESQNCRYPRPPLEPEQKNIVIANGPFTVGAAFDAINSFILPYLEPELYRIFLTESGMAHLAIYLENVQLLANTYPIDYAVRILGIHMEAGHPYGMSDKWPRMVSAEHQDYMDLMWALNYASLEPPYWRSKWEDVIVGAIHKVMTKGSFPGPYMAGLEAFVAHQGCSHNQDKPLCAFLWDWGIKELLGDTKLNLNNSPVYRLAIRQKPDELFEYALQDARIMSRYLLAEQPTIEDLEYRTEDERVKFSVQAIIDAYRWMLQNSDEALGRGFPTPLCQTADHNNSVYIPLEELKLDEFENYENPTKEKISRALIELFTGTSADERGKFSYVYDMSLHNQLDELAQEICLAKKAPRRVHFV